MDKKSLWIVSDSEPIPELTNRGKKMRAGTFCSFAVKTGFDVQWISSTWMHYEERVISNQQVLMKLADGTKLCLLNAKKGYKKHVSVSRLLYNKRMERLFQNYIKSCSERPDVIVVSWPLIELAYRCVKYGKRHGIPVVIDIRDLWPDIFVQPFSGLKKTIVGVATKLLYRRKVTYSMRNATQIIGVTRDALGLSYKWGRPKNELDRLLYLSTTKTNEQDDSFRDAQERWASLGIKKGDKILMFAGSVQLRIARLDLVVAAASKIPDVKFVICGDGYSREQLKEQAKTLPNVLFPGYMSEMELKALGSLATVSLLPYENLPDFYNSIPTKFGEYLSYGLPVLTYLKGDSRKLLEKYQCGFYYSNVEDLCDLINRYCHDEKLLAAHKKNALKLFEECFNAEKTYTGFFEQLKTLRRRNNK